MNLGFRDEVPCRLGMSAQAAAFTQTSPSHQSSFDARTDVWTDARNQKRPCSFDERTRTEGVTRRLPTADCRLPSNGRPRKQANNKMIAACKCNQVRMGDPCCVYVKNIRTERTDGREWTGDDGSPAVRADDQGSGLAERHTLNKSRSNLYRTMVIAGQNRRVPVGNSCNAIRNQCMSNPLSTSWLLVCTLFMPLA